MQYGNVGYQHGASATHGLDGWQTKTFVERWEDETGGLIVEPNELFVGDATEKSDRGQVPVRF